MNNLPMHPVNPLTKWHAMHPDIPHSIILLRLTANARQIYWSKGETATTQWVMCGLKRKSFLHLYGRTCDDANEVAHFLL